MQSKKINLLNKERKRERGKRERWRENTDEGVYVYVCG